MHRTDAGDVARQQKEAGEGQKQGVVHLAEGVAVGDEDRHQNDGQADVIGHDAEHREDGQGEQNEIKRGCFG